MPLNLPRNTQQKTCFSSVLKRFSLSAQARSISFQPPSQLFFYTGYSYAKSTSVFCTEYSNAKSTAVFYTEYSYAKSTAVFYT